MSAPDQWLLWQLADSAFPAGSFGHSGGLEAAWQLGEVTARNLEAFLQTSVAQLSRAALPFVLEAHREPARFESLDKLNEVFLSNHVVRRASQLLGKSFVVAADQSFPSPALAEFRNNSGHTHFAPTFGVITRLLEIQLADSARLFIFINLRGWLASAVRLGIIGPLEAQRIQFRLNPLAEEISRASSHFSIDDLATTAPLLDIWQGAHDRLYSRLFQT